MRSVLPSNTSLHAREVRTSQAVLKPRALVQGKRLLVLSRVTRGAAEGPQKPFRWSPELSNSLTWLGRQRAGSVPNSPVFGDG